MRLFKALTNICIFVKTVESCSYAIKEAPIQQMFNMTYWKEWQPTETTAEWNRQSGKLFHRGSEFIVKGINFNGFETTDCRVPLGLNEKPLNFFLDFLEQNHFNVLRLPLSYEIMSNLQLQIGFCVQSEPNLRPGQPVQSALQLVMDEAWKRGIFVIVDLHTIEGNITPFPWTDTVNENMVAEAWLLFLKQFHQHPALMGIEIKNEPHDTITLEIFMQHCTKVIKNIDAYLPAYKGLYFISGIQKDGPWGGAFDRQIMTSAGFSGLTHPSILSTIDVTRLVLTPHIYGTSVRGHNVSIEGENEWEHQYGFVRTLPNHWNQSVIIPTEIGGTFDGEDRDYYERWMKWHVYKKGMTSGAFWWTLCPFSADTGGIFNSDYSINWDKVDFMTKLVPNPTLIKKPPKTFLRRGKGKTES